MSSNSRSSYLPKRLLLDAKKVGEVVTINNENIQIKHKGLLKPSTGSLGFGYILQPKSLHEEGPSAQLTSGLGLLSPVNTSNGALGLFDKYDNAHGLFDEHDSALGLS